MNKSEHKDQVFVTRGMLEDIIDELPVFIAVSSYGGTNQYRTKASGHLKVVLRLVEKPGDPLMEIVDISIAHVRSSGPTIQNPGLTVSLTSEPASMIEVLGNELRNAWAKLSTPTVEHCLKTFKPEDVKLPKGFNLAFEPYRDKSGYRLSLWLQESVLFNSSRKVTLGSIEICFQEDLSHLLSTAILFGDTDSGYLVNPPEPFPGAVRLM